ncbi:hypothetical protein MTR67_050694 [Solanum verrucosum]|uniref:Reverse transcriptase zinc-binding domain-containing protein n=1 Tax=Solanum verrucosum TaxID=315347 RepID=A0AAF0V4W8_SOLVR|nr:hypothetical protein MTR67_050694 [Solanum verrucosum]
MYYGKQGTLWGVLAPQASWMVRKILQMHKELKDIDWNEELLTRDRLATWGCAEDVHCVLCGTEDESHNHIFFRCLFSSQVWQKVLCWQSIHREARGWEEEITWERNQRIFQKITRTPAMVAKQVVQEVHMRGRTKPRLSYVLQTLNFYPV